jgi:hypothetical protein
MKCTRQREQYFNVLTEEYQSISSFFVRNVDEIWIRTPKKTASPNMSVSASRKSATVALSEEK